MSFSSEVKLELSKNIIKARHCQIAELSAIIGLCGKIMISEFDEYSIKIYTENLFVAERFCQLLKLAFKILPSISTKKNMYLKIKKSRMYTVCVDEPNASLKVLKAIKFIDRNNNLRDDLAIVDSLITQNTCCKRAFIRGSFLATGSVNDPEKTYHFEIVCNDETKANQLKDIINVFNVEAKVVARKKYYIVYIKEGAMIVEMLNIMEAHISLMKLENVRILKEMRNSVNRRVNCETANINKTVSASVRQVEDIKYIKETIGFSSLSDGLEEIANLRLKQPEATLKELGAMLSVPVSKSGVNHRLRKLSNIANDLREKNLTK